MIDAHIHLWQIGRNDCRWPGPDLRGIHRDFTPTDLLPELAANGVDAAIAVQSQESEADTLWLLDMAAQHDAIVGVVGWTDLISPDVVAHIDRLVEAGPLVGIRPMVQDRIDDWYDQDALIPGMAALAQKGQALDALVQSRHLPSLGRLARRMPGLSIIVDHCAKPAVGSDALAPWLEAMVALAACSNVSCKLSGLLTECVPGAEMGAACFCIDAVVDAFGPDRLIWGSDWPVVTLATSYNAWLNLARHSIPMNHHAAIFSDNAARIYRLRMPT